METTTSIEETISTITSEAISTEGPTAPDLNAVEAVTLAPDTSKSGSAEDDYLRGGYFKGEGLGRYINPALVDETAKKLAETLANGGMKQSGFNSIIRELKKANKRTLPLEAKIGALSGAIPQAKQLVQRKRAPAILVDIMERNRAAVKNDADYSAAVKHLAAVAIFMGDYI